VADDANPIPIHIRLASEESYRRPDILDVAELIADIAGPIALSKHDESALDKGLRQPFQRCYSRAEAGGQDKCGAPSLSIGQLVKRPLHRLTGAGQDDGGLGDLSSGDRWVRTCACGDNGRENGYT
jgi:hypothetical protein